MRMLEEAVVKIAGVEMLVDYEFDITSSGCSAHMGSLSYEGHPAEPAEFEITVYGIAFPKQASDFGPLEMPPWLKDLLTTHLSEREDINDIVQQADMRRDCSDDWDYER